MSETATYCWNNESRMCGGDCEAFDPDGAADETGVRTRCRILNTNDAMARALVSLAKLFRGMRAVPGTQIDPPGVM